MTKVRQIAFTAKVGSASPPPPRTRVVALAEMGQKVLIVGCDPKAESDPADPSIRRRSFPVLQMAAEKGSVEDLEPEEVIRVGFKGIRCVEFGGPEPGVGCAGRGVITAINFLEENGA